MYMSPLRSHKRQHNFSDTPSEIYECHLGIEGTRHFLFEYISSTTQRVTLSSVNIINIFQWNNLNHLGNQPELYLYGHPSLDVTVNRKVLLSTKRYIKDPKRFSTVS